MGALRDEAQVVWAAPWILIRAETSGPGQEARPVYRIFPIEALQRFLSSTPVEVVEFRPGMTCVLHEGNSCWKYAIDRMRQRDQRTLVLLAILASGLAAAVAWLLVRGWERRRREQERRRFAFQMLTHELRTPITGLVLSSDALRSEFESLPERVQPTLLRMFDDVQRLMRLTEASRQYLTSISQQKIDLKPARIESARQWLEDQAYEIDSTIEVRCARDFSFTADPYWLSICVSNLLKNSIAHGARPIWIELSRAGDWMEVSVVDQGQLSDADLEELTQPFRKGKSSQGLGLGLSIVREIAQEMGGKLRLEASPTRFTLSLPLEGAAK
jgi:signal transduction histidine kinase